MLFHDEAVKMKGASQRDISGIIAAGRPYTTNAGKDAHARDGSTRLVTAPSSCGAVLVRVVAFS
jgi:hypothetical protein